MSLKPPKLWLLLLLGLLNAVACGQAPSGSHTAGASDQPAATQPSAPAKFKLILLHVNDIHGQTQERLVNGKSVGGYARLATAVQKVRDGAGQGTGVLLLHAGDEFSRGDGLTRATVGRANIKLMNEIGFDAFTPGNGEFYDGWDNLRACAKLAKFPFLMANVTPVLPNKPQPMSGTMIRQVGPVKVAIFGLCFIRTQLPGAWGLNVEDPIQKARQLVPQLRKQADVVVALTHIGLSEDKNLAQAVPGIDVIVGGHSHSKLPQGLVVKGPGGGAVLICQAGDTLRYLGEAQLSLTRHNGGYRIAKERASLIELDQKVPQDPKVKALIARLAAATQPSTKPATETPAK